MSRLAYFMLLLLLPFISGCVQSQPKNSEPSTSQIAIDKGKKLIQALMERDKVAGLSITVMKGEEIIWSEGFGYADLEQEIPVYPDKTKFRVGSISKPMTAAMLAQLYEAGKLDLDAPVQTYVPDFPQKQYEITTRQLAGHLGGIRHYNGSEFLSSEHYTTVDEGLVIFKNDPLIHPPGSKYRYSSYGWNLISAVLEGASGEEFLDYMQRNVFDKLNLENTAADQNADIIPFRTRFYVTNADGEVKNAPYVDNSYKWAGGGFISTSEDVARFALAHLHPGFLQAETLKLLITSQKTTDGEETGYGLGWRSGTTQNGKYWFGHSGGSVGGTSQMVIFPEQELIVVMLTNASGVNYNGLQLEIGELFW